MKDSIQDNYLKKELYELIKSDESIFDFIQSSSLDGLWYWDLEKPENEWMNPKFWTVLGYNPDEMPHKASAWQNIINHDDLKIASDNFTKHCENPNHPYDQIVRYTHKNGSIVWIRCRGLAIRDKNGKTIRMLGAHHDITEIKKSEQELKKTTEIFAEAERISNLGAWELDLSTNRTYWTDNVYAIHEVEKGFDHNKANGIEFYHPDYRQVITDAISKSITEQVSFDEQCKFITAKGNEKWVRTTGHPIVENGKVTKLFGVFIDITKQKQTEQKLEQQNLFISTLLDNLKVGVVACDENENLTYFNKTTQEFHGLPHQKINAELWADYYDLYLPDGKTKMQKKDIPLFRALKGEQFNDVEMIIFPKQGKPSIFVASGSPIFDDEGKKQGAVVSMYNIDERIKAEQALKESEAQLKELNTTKDKFFSIIAHDLKNPFNSLLGFSDLLVKNALKYPPEKVQQFAQTMNSAANQGYKLLENLLEWSRLQTGSIKPNPVKVKPSDLIYEVKLLCEQTAKSKNIELQSLNDCNDYILADKEMIKTVLRNLITNSLKFTKEQDIVKISTQRLDNHVVFIISDTGIGIEPEHIAKIFNIDCKLSKEGTAGEKGTGLGLILCKEFVEIHGGQIWVESEVGKGSDFKFTLPLCND